MGHIVPSVSDEETRTAWCGDCGHEYEDGPALAAAPPAERPACPNCGSRRYTFSITLHATVSQSASMAAYKSPTTSGEAVRVSRGGDDSRVAGAGFSPTGDLSDHIEGRASPKGSSELRAATILVEHLNSRGATWAPPNLYRGREIGVDAVAEDGSERLQIQVTTPERTAWGPLANTSRLERSEPDVKTAVEAIRLAIDGKTLFSELGEIVLALDATDSTQYALQTVVDAFRAQHSVWAKTIGYKAIWIVGPVKELVHQLDT